MKRIGQIPVFAGLLFALFDMVCRGAARVMTFTAHHLAYADFCD